MIFTFILIKFISIKPAFSGNYPTSPHGDSTNGVSRLNAVGEPIGSCTHCHYEHYSYENSSPPHTAGGYETEVGGPFNYLLFKNITNAGNATCFKTTGCHKEAPSTYPAQESHRMPTGSTYPGYFEKNIGADIKQWGVDNRARWTGQTVWENTTYSAHYNLDATKTEMEKDSNNKGKCTNCHSPHGTQSAYDMLIGMSDTGALFESVTNPYTGIKDSYLAGNRDSQGRPKNYELCFSCHSNDASARSAGMNASSKNIGSYYSQTTNNNYQSGHQIRQSTGAASAWPAWVQVGDKLSCSDCHNPHGTNNNNAKLITDQRGQLNYSNASAAEVREFCFGCHIASNDAASSKSVEGITMARIPQLDTTDAHITTGTTSCFNCHGNDYTSTTSKNPHNPNPGQCSSCHSFYTTMNAPGGSDYVHKITIDGAYYDDEPNIAFPTDRTCVNTCHIGHKYFSPATGGTTRSSNLHKVYSEATPTKTNYDNDTGTTSRICFSCHTSAQTRSYSMPHSNTDTTTALNETDFNSGIHAYTGVTSTFNSDSTTYNSRCTKCHNDTTTKNYQSSTYKFALHTSNRRYFVSPLGYGGAEDALEENFCYQCHSGAGPNDYYGAKAMDTDARGISTAFGLTNKHPVTTYNANHDPVEDAASDFAAGGQRHVECADCHNPHTTQDQTAEADGKPLIGATGVYPTSWPSAPVPTNNSNSFAAPSAGYTWTTITSTNPKQSEYTICLKCHSNFTTQPSPGNNDFFNRALASQRNIAEEINPNYIAYHGIVPVAGAAPNRLSVGHNAQINSNDTTLLTTYNGLQNRFPVGAGAEATVFCSDCHTLDPTANPEGPHGSNVNKLLVDTITSTQAGGTPLCLKCHVSKYWISGTPTGTIFSKHGDGNHGNGDTCNARGCFTCHMWEYASCSLVGPQTGGMALGSNATGCGGTSYGTGMIFVHGQNKKWVYKDYGNDGNQGTNAGTPCGATAAGLLQMNDAFLNGMQADEDYTNKKCWTEVCRNHSNTGW